MAPGEGRERYREVRIPHSPRVSRSRVPVPLANRLCQEDFFLPWRRPLLPCSPLLAALFSSLAVPAFADFSAATLRTIVRCLTRPGTATMSLPLPRSPLPVFGDSSEHSEPRSPLGGHSPLSSASPVSAGGLRGGTSADSAVFGEEEDPLPATRPTGDEQDIAALLLGDYRPGRDWHPDPLPTTPPPDTVIG